MVKKVDLPKDEQPHWGQAIEWWYFNGFLESKRKRYAFMTCLFKADRKKVNLKFLKIPVKTVFFSHSLLYDINNKKVRREIIPFASLSKDSFKSKDLHVEYFFPLMPWRSNIISRTGKGLRLKTRFFNLDAVEKKRPLLENGSGFIDLGRKTTYYYTYPHLELKGTLGKEEVKGIAWHDKQWSDQGFMDDSWLWFSLQLPDNTQIVCFDFQGKRMATISYPDNRQVTCDVKFEPLADPWKSHKTGTEYCLRWRIRAKDFVIETKPLIEDCEMRFGFINYWEGPLEITCKWKKGKGFMELLAKKRVS
jgi:predicted secreted hydrolase